MPTKHTKGPWRWLEGYDSLGPPPEDASGPIEDGLYGPDDEPVVMGVYRNDGMADCMASSEANARLISLAPEMLEAVREVEAAMEWGDPHNETGLTHEERMAQALCVVKAVIARAEGTDE